MENVRPVITESQNDRMFRVGRDLCGSSSPTPLSKQGYLQQSAQDLVQAGLEYLQRRRLHSLTGQPVPVLRHPQRVEVLRGYEYRRKRCVFTVMLRWTESLYSEPCLSLLCRSFKRFLFIVLLINAYMHAHVYTCTCTHTYLYIYICIYTQMLPLSLFWCGFPDTTGVIGI